MDKKNIFLYLVIFCFGYVSFFAFITNNLLAKNRSLYKTSEKVEKPIKGVFNSDPEADNESSIELILVGDVMLGRTVMGKSYELEDYSYPFRKIADEISDADIVFANLENPIVKDCPFTETSLIFCSTPKMLEGLKLSNINVVNLANNHIGNYGNTGIMQTIEYLDGTNIDYTGRGELLVVNVKGISLGFLGFNYTFGYSAEMIEKDLELIRTSNEKVDYLIVGVHWGQEYVAEPNNFQIDMAGKMIDVGADIISGHHPHWIQTSEIIDGKPVYYSLGNFVFDQMWSEKTRTGLLIKLLIDKDGIVELGRRRVYMKDWAQPETLKTE